MSISAPDCQFCASVTAYPAAAGSAQIDSILSAPPDRAMAGDPLPVLALWRGRGGLPVSRWNRPSSLAEYPPSGFPRGAEQVLPRR